jgi:predicted nucleic acid-binding protein
VSPPRFVVDTDVLSETARPRPDPRVMAWLAGQGAIAISSVTVYELARGVERLPAGRRRRFLEAWLGRLLDVSFEVVPFDQEAALAAAHLERDASHRGKSIDTRDLFILAAARTRRLALATRNLAHFRGCGVSIYDPFADLHAV